MICGNTPGRWVESHVVRVVEKQVQLNVHVARTRNCQKHPGTRIGSIAARLAFDDWLCDNYVMRSTRHVVRSPGDSQLGHYSDPPLLVLASLASGPKHGHAMIEDIATLCGTRLGPGTLYGAIARLEQQGWIQPLPAEERRRPYRITTQGARVLHAKLTTLQQFAKAGIRRLELA